MLRLLLSVLLSFDASRVCLDFLINVLVERYLFKVVLEFLDHSLILQTSDIGVLDIFVESCPDSARVFVFLNSWRLILIDGDRSVLVIVVSESVGDGALLHLLVQKAIQV